MSDAVTPLFDFQWLFYNFATYVLIHREYAGKYQIGA